MKTKSTKYIEVTITMDELETAWLRAVMQNALHEDETETDKTMRAIFWNAINDELLECHKDEPKNYNMQQGE